MKNKFILIIGTLFCISFANDAMAASEKSLELAKKLVKVIHATDDFDNFLPAEASNIKAQLVSKDPSHADKISKIVDQEALKLVHKRAELDEAAANVYASNFSDDELQAIYNFYSSSAGKKLLSTAPQTISSLVKSFQKWSAEISKELTANVSKELDK